MNLAPKMKTFRIVYESEFTDQLSQYFIFFGCCSLEMKSEVLEGANLLLLKASCVLWCGAVVGSSRRLQSEVSCWEGCKISGNQKQF